MKVHDIRDAEGRIRAFEVDNFGIGRREVCGIVRGIPGAVVARGPRLLSWIREEEFCAFSIHGRPFIIWEPFGDNSRYWVGTDPPESYAEEEIEMVRQAFVDYHPSVVPFNRLFRRKV